MKNEDSNYLNKKADLQGFILIVVLISIFVSILLYFCLLTPPKGWAASPLQFSTDEENQIKFALFLLPVLTTVVMLTWYFIKLHWLKEHKD
jgi:hypothetical protein